MNRKRLASGARKYIAKKSRSTSNGPKSVYPPTRRYSIPPVVRCGRQAFPKQLSNTVRYSDSQVLTIPALSSSTYVIYSVNGLYDPDSAAGGHQPMYFDQLMEIYNHYFVTNSRITVTLASTSATTPITAGLYIDDDTTVVSGANYAFEHGGQCKAYDPNSGNFYPMTASWNVNKAFGVTSGNQKDFYGTNASNPTEQQHYVFTVNNSTAGDTFLITINIEYDAIFTELKTIGGS